MKGCEYIVDYLASHGVTDAFGIPGGVVLDLLYAMDDKEGITPHLSYHEQAAGFAACGYAQASGKLGVAYATRGPGFTNLITAIADAYYDSLPVLFITAHAASCPPKGMRVMDDQEMDTCNMVRNITKEAVRADDVETFADVFAKLCHSAVEGRKGPVLLDVSAKVLKQELPVFNEERKDVRKEIFDCKSACKDIVESVRTAKRPVLLVGDGIHQAGAEKLLCQFIKSASIPTVSSRFSHDLMGKSEQYFGYVGSHGTRCANFILSKTDLIIALGNRLHFPVASQTFRDVFKHARLIRCEIDNGEMMREVPNSTCYQVDVAEVLGELADTLYDDGEHKEWMRICHELKGELHEEDMNEPVRMIAGILSGIPANWSVVSDVGTNEFWVSRASVYTGNNHRTYYSKSFGALGCGLGKAIGVYYATHRPVVSFIGDQGLQMNIQELQFIGQHRLPIFVVLINNSASGMIRDREKSFGKFLHTTKDSGFRSPCYKEIAKGYGIGYHLLSKTSEMDTLICTSLHPTLVEMVVDEGVGLTPNLPRGSECQNMCPALAKKKYEYLNQL